MPSTLVEVVPVRVDHNGDTYKIVYSDGHEVEKIVRDDADLHDVQMLIEQVRIHL